MKAFTEILKAQRMWWSRDGEPKSAWIMAWVWKGTWTSTSPGIWLSLGITQVLWKTAEVKVTLQIPLNQSLWGQGQAFTLFLTSCPCDAICDQGREQHLTIETGVTCLKAGTQAWDLSSPRPSVIVCHSAPHSLPCWEPPRGCHGVSVTPPTFLQAGMALLPEG